MVSIQSRQIGELRETISHSNRETNATVDRLTVQIGAFASSVTELKHLSREILTTIGHQTEAINGHLTVTGEQSSNIAQLIELARQQQTTVDRFLSKN